MLSGIYSISQKTFWLVGLRQAGDGIHKLEDEKKAISRSHLCILLFQTLAMMIWCPLEVAPNYKVKIFTIAS